MKPRSDKDDQTVPKLYGSTAVAKDLKVDPSAPPAFQDDSKNAPASVPASVLEDAAANPRNYRAPAFQKIRRDENLNQDVDVEQRGGSNNNEYDEKVCRICLEEDSPETMIAPCRCKGSSNWVHRECLDEWRTNEHDRAFSKCTECLFEYYLQPVYEDDDDDDNETCGNGKCGPGCSKQQRRRLHFCGMVSRDLCWGLLAQQAVVALLGLLVWLIVASNSDYDSDPGTNGRGPGLGLGPCYLLGWFVFLVGLGLYGSIVLCANGCDLKKAIPRVGPPSEAETEARAGVGTRSGATSGACEATSASASAPFREGYQSDPMARGYHYTRCEDDDYYDDDGYRDFSGNRRWQRDAEGPSVQYYRRARRRHREYRRRWYDNDYDYYDDYYHRNRYSNYYYYGPTYYPMYVYPTGNHCCCCCCCCDSHGPPVNAHALGGSGCCDCDLGGCLRILHGHVRNSSGGGGSRSGNRRSNNRDDDNKNNNSGNDATHILLVILLVVAIILAVIGFFVGVAVVVVAAQRIVARHVHLLQKRQLVREFRVLDLQEYDLDAPTATAPTEDEVRAGDDDNNNNDDAVHPKHPGLGVGTKHPPPSAPLLQEDDTAYLQSLGLMDRR